MRLCVHYGYYEESDSPTLTDADVWSDGFSHLLMLLLPILHLKGRSKQRVLGHGLCPAGLVRSVDIGGLLCGHCGHLVDLTRPQRLCPWKETKFNALISTPLCTHVIIHAKLECRD